MAIAPKDVVKKRGKMAHYHGFSCGALSVYKLKLKEPGPFFLHFFEVIAILVP